MIERQGPGGAWQHAAGGSIGYPAALAARARRRPGAGDRLGRPGRGRTPGRPSNSSRHANRSRTSRRPGQAPLLTDPYPLAGAGLSCARPATGWRDEQRQSYPLPGQQRPKQTLYDLPVRPDPVLALLIAPDGSDGWAVGGETGTSSPSGRRRSRPPAAMRYGPAATPPSNAATGRDPDAPAGPRPSRSAATPSAPPPAPTTAAPGSAPTAGCAPRSAAPAGGGRVCAPSSTPAPASPPTTAAPLRELTAGPAIGARLRPRGERLRRAASAPRRRAAGLRRRRRNPTSTAAGSLGTFVGRLRRLRRAARRRRPRRRGSRRSRQTGRGQGYYSFDSSGNGGAVRVIVLDYSRPRARRPAALLARPAALRRPPRRPPGDRRRRARPRRPGRPTRPSDRAQTIQALVGGSAPRRLRAARAGRRRLGLPLRLSRSRTAPTGSTPAAARSPPTAAARSATSPRPPPTDTEFAGASGFLLVSVDAAEPRRRHQRRPGRRRSWSPRSAPLALDATDGTLLRRSQPALFEGARPPAAGGLASARASRRAADLRTCSAPDPYVPIPAECQGANCATSLFPEYTFTSSQPDIADFVAPDPASTNPRNVQLVKGKPVLDPHSGLLCAFNAGTTTVTVTTGGLSYSQKVTVQPGHRAAALRDDAAAQPLRGRARRSTRRRPRPRPRKASPPPNESPPPPAAAAAVGPGAGQPAGRGAGRAAATAGRRHLPAGPGGRGDAAGPDRAAAAAAGGAADPAERHLAGQRGGGRRGARGGRPNRPR